MTSTEESIKKEYNARLNLTKRDGESDEDAWARTVLAPHNRHGMLSEFFSLSIGGRDKQDINATTNEFKQRVDRVKAGDMSDIESMLVSQSITLDAIFGDMAFISAANIGSNSKTVETYMRMALKAQSQCRCTLEALNEMKNPKSVTITKQANFAEQQVVNNGTMNAGSTHAEEKHKNESNELLEVIEHGKVDTGTKSETISGNQKVETVEAVNRSKDSRGKS